MTIKIRKFREDDAKEISQVGTRSWFHTYSHIFDQTYLEEKTSNSYNQDTIKKQLKLQNIRKRL